MDDLSHRPDSGPLPLTGLRVLDVSIWVQGPLGAMMLADLGADVIKVEKPGVGDFARGAKTIFGRSQELPGGRALMFEIANRNKRSVGIDLAHPRGREAFYRLVQKSDAFVTNLHPGSLEKFGIDRTALTSVNPHLIYAQATGYGSAGPAALDPCQDTTGMARSGFMFNAPSPDGAPTYQVGTLSDVLSATMLAFAIVTALLNRERWGTALGVMCSQLSAMMWLQYYSIAQFANSGQAFVPHDRKNAANPLVNIYRCKDDKWIACGMFLSQRFVWSEFCEVLGVPQLANDERFEDDQGRNRYNRELILALDSAFATQDRSYWEKVLQQKGYWISVVNNMEDLINDPQVSENNYLVRSAGGLTTVRFPFGFAGLEIPTPKDAPSFGHDTESVLADVAGYSIQDIIDLKVAGAVW
jgi:crotonobetainyl-CoA:carnitine CoA-transferase CaiB-like acyl-CoA transferase